MIRGAIRLAIVGAGITYALDKILTEQAKGEPPEPISSLIVIDAPIERSGRCSPTSAASPSG